MLPSIIITATLIRLPRPAPLGKLSLVPRLIVNADDFGLTPGVNQAIAELHQAGLVTSASLMARASATAEAISIARSTPSLGVGCHLVFVDGRPVLPVSQLPNLVDPHTGCFYGSLAPVLLRLFSGSRRQAALLREIEAEACAQIFSLQNQGVHLTHVDTHKHLHMFPPVLRAILRAAHPAGLRAVRNPFEPLWALRATRSPSLIRFAEVFVLRWLQPRCLRIVANAGFTTTSGTIAVVGTGHLDLANATALLSNAQPGTWELVTHPGYNDADLARIPTRLRESRDVERLALRALDNFPSIGRINFAQLGPVAKTDSI